eukprot:Rmarinus@m.9727
MVDSVTKLKYFEDTYNFECDAKVVHVLEIPLEERKSGGQYAVILDETVMYPQGGGQPADSGAICAKEPENIFSICDVRMVGKAVHHIGNFAGGRVFDVGQPVAVSVTESRRRLHARLHSAGHLLDACVTKAGYTQLTPGKGYHFAQSPYVEYIGVIAPEDREDAAKLLGSLLDELVEENTPVEVSYTTSAEKLSELCGPGFESYFDHTPEVRVVSMSGTSSPCGGTHVKQTGEIGKVKVASIKVKKGRTRVSYALEKAEA